MIRRILIASVAFSICLLGLGTAVAGRVVYSLAPGLHGPIVVVAVIGSLVTVAIAEAILQPVCYSGVKQYTDEKTSSMGYGLIYAVMNLGIVGIGALSAWLRPAVWLPHAPQSAG